MNSSAGTLSFVRMKYDWGGDVAVGVVLLLSAEVEEVLVLADVPALERGVAADVVARALSLALGLTVGEGRSASASIAALACFSKLPGSASSAMLARTYC
jgi:hypothetical protein